MNDAPDVHVEWNYDDETSTGPTYLCAYENADRYLCTKPRGHDGEHRFHGVLEGPGPMTMPDVRFKAAWPPDVSEETT